MKLLNDAGLVHQVEIIKGLFHDEEEQRSRQDETLRDKIDEEIQDRQDSDNELDQKIDQTKQEIEDAIEETLGDYATKQEVSLIPKFAIAVVNELPEEDISPTTVYLLAGGSEQGNLYTEYIYVNNAWETLGSQALDLTGYATKDWVSGVLQGYLSTDGGTMTGSIEWENGDGTFGIRETQADNPNKTTYDIGWNHQNRDGAGLGLRSSDSTLETGQFHLYARDDTQTSTLQGSPDGTLKWNTNIVNQDGTSTTVYRDVVVDVSEGQTNGTISVNGSDVPVHGLGSAAYTDSTEYASSSHTHDYLPLSGGTLTGTLYTSGNIFKSTNTSTLSINGGNQYNNAYLNLYGGDHADSPGIFSLAAYDGTNRKQLLGYPDGRLFWAGNAVATTNNTVNLEGNQTVNGLKTFTTYVNRTASNLDMTSTTVHEASSTNLRDKDGNLVGCNLHGLSSTMAWNALRTAHPSLTTNNVSNWADIRLYVDTDKKYWAEYTGHGNLTLDLPSGNNTKRIPTTAWVQGELGSYSKTNHTHNYLPLAGGTMTGSITSNNTIPLKVTTTYNDGSGSTYTSDVIRANTSNSPYGNNIAIGGGGNTIIGGGESYSAQLNALEGNSAENCYVCADGDVYIKPNCNTFANAKEFVFKNNGSASFPASIFADGLLIFQQPGVSAKGTNPSAWKEQSVRFADASGEASDAHLLGMIRNEIGTNGNVITRMVSYKNASGSSDNESIGVVYPASGDPYTFAPTPATSDNSSKIATTAYVKSNLANYSTTSHTHSYLPLSGGTMTGLIKKNGNVVYADDAQFTRFMGGSSDTKGAGLTLGGKDHSWAGHWELKAHDGTNSKVLAGYANGTLTWGGTAISLNGHTHSYLPLSGGTLTSGGYINKKTSLTKGTKPSSTAWALSNIVFDSVGTATADRMSEYRSYVDANGKTGTEILSYDFTSGATSNAYLGVYKDLNGAAHVDTNGQLVINRDNSSVGGGIKLTGSAQNFAISAQNTSVTKGTAPSSTQYWGIDFYGKDQDNYNKRIGMLETSLNADNVVQTGIYAYNCTTNTNTANASIRVYVDGNGNGYTYAPTPASTDNSTKIATTAFVKSIVGGGGEGEGEGIAKKGTWYIRYESGVQICWGVTDASTTSVTFGQPFKDTNIAIIQGDLNSSRADRMTYDEKRIDSWTKTGFTYHNGCCQRGWIAIGKWK